MGLPLPGRYLEKMCRALVDCLMAPHLRHLMMPEQGLLALTSSSYMVLVVHPPSSSRGRGFMLVQGASKDFRWPPGPHLWAARC